MSVKKRIIENYNSVGTGAHKVEKVVSFWSKLDPNLPIFVNSEKGKLYIKKKYGLSTFKEVHLKYVHNSTFIFFSMY